MPPLPPGARRRSREREQARHGAPVVRVALVTMGCPKNTVDSEEMAGVLRDAGYVVVADWKTAHVIIVNSCGFLAAAEDECRETVAALRGACPRAKILVAGCMTQRRGAEWALTLGADGAIGVGRMADIAMIVRDLLQGQQPDLCGSAPVHHWALPEQRLLSTPPGVAWMKISEGCDHRCAFCTIPSFRGGHVSKPIDRLLREAEVLSERGVQELVLIAQDTTRYGRDLDGYRDGLAGLLGHLSNIGQFRWIRVMYMCPDGISDSLIEAMCHLDRVVPYFDIPWQHCSERVLNAMRRWGSRDRYSSLVARIRSERPDAAFRGTFIVGHPGEDQAAFDELMDWLESMQFDWAVAFPFSAEEGTEAAGMECVPSSVAQERYHRLMSLQQSICLRRAQSLVGKTMDVLVEKRCRSRHGIGRTYREAPEVDGVVEVKGAIGEPGRICRVRITGGSAYSLQGVIEPDTVKSCSSKAEHQQDTNQEVA